MILAHVATMMMLHAPAMTLPDDVTFEEPVELTADGKAYRDYLYPSPVLHDINGDGTAELVVGDLFGFLSVSERLSPGDATSWGAAKKLQGTDGKDLKFSNW